MNIAVYSGSFNPLHIGHLAIMKHLLEVAGFDMVYLVVSPKNPLKDSISSDSGLERYKAAVEAVNRHFNMTSSRTSLCGEDMPFPAINRERSDKCSSGSLQRAAGAGGIGTTAALEDAKVKVDDIELTMPEPHYTIRTLDALKAREPENIFTLVMGADNLADIHRWKEYSRILTDYGTAVFPRKGLKLTQIRRDLLNENPAYRIQILDAEMVDVSSTQIREAIADGRDTSHLLM